MHYAKSKQSHYSKHVGAALTAYVQSRKLHVTEIPKPHTLLHFLADILHYAESMGEDASKLLAHARDLYLSERES